MIVSNPILQPVVALASWSMLIWLWMLVTRIPAMQAMKIPLDPDVPPKSLTDPLPASIRWKADNYNHLMEQPTVFYAVALTLALADPSSQLATSAAWAYVGLRILHSMVQTTFNHILTRLALFVMSSAVLILLAVLAARAVS